MSQKDILFTTTGNKAFSRQDIEILAGLAEIFTATISDQIAQSSHSIKNRTGENICFLLEHFGVHGLQPKHCCKPRIPFMAVASPSRTSAHCKNCSGTAQAIQQTCSPNSRGPGGTSVGSARTSLHHATYSFLIFGWSEPL